MKITVQTDKMNSPKVYQNAISSYEKGSFFCVQYTVEVQETVPMVWYYDGVQIPKQFNMSTESTKTKTFIDKYPINTLFRVMEEY
jgi:hypothetical protein